MQNRPWISWATLLLLGLTGTATANPNVVVSIAPLHSWVSQVSAGLWEPELLLSADTDPHNSLLRPSQRQLVEDADWVVWVGPQLETGLETLMHRVEADRRWTLADEQHTGLVTYDYRESGAFFSAPPPEAAAPEHGHGHSHGHNLDHDGEDHHAIDPHLWLDPENARRALAYISTRLSELDPANAEQYAANAATAIARLAQDEQRWRERLATAQLKPYVVFHDGYQYFDRAFDIPFAGAVTMNPEQLPGLRTINRMREAMDGGEVGCLFAEVQYPDRLVSAVGSGFGLEVRRLDALGVSIEPGADHYRQMMDRLVDQFTQCG